MSDESKPSFLSEEYPISNESADLSNHRLSKTRNSNENIEKISNNQPESKDNKNDVSLVSLAEEEKLDSLLSSKNVCGLKKMSSLNSLRLKSYKIKETFDSLRCGSISKSENLSLKKLSTNESPLNFFKFSFESKSSDTDIPNVQGSSFIYSPFTIELTDTGTVPSTILMSASPNSSLRQKKFTNSFEITLEKPNKLQPQTNSEKERLCLESFSKTEVDQEELKSNNGNSNYKILVAIDFGTTHSGYAYAYLKNPNEIHLMKRWSDGETRFSTFKVPTTLLLSPTGEFHSFGYQAIEFYNDLEPSQAKDWNFFEKFKMSLHNSQTLNRETVIKASNGKEFLALEIFSQSLSWFKESALKELNSHSEEKHLNENIKWVLTVPAIWKQPAKSFMREAACQAKLITKENPDQLIIALEPEAASIYIRQLQSNQLLLENSLVKQSKSDKDDTQSLVGSNMSSGTRYVVVDCGGGTIDVTIHEINEADSTGYLKELYKASGGPFGSMVVDLEFEKLLKNIFSNDFIDEFVTNFPASYNSLMSTFESKKRRISFDNPNYLNITLPYSFIDFYKKKTGDKIENAIRKYNTNKDFVKEKTDWIFWSTQGMLRLSIYAIKKLFEPAIEGICGIIDRVVNNQHVKNVDYLFLVGGFAESIYLQEAINSKYSSNFKIIIPRDVSSCVLKGAVMFGLNPSIIRLRRSPLTYGICALKLFNEGIHLQEKRITRNGVDWCVDWWDKFVVTDQQVSTNETFMRRYATVNNFDQNQINIDFYCSELDSSQYVTDDESIKKCATIILYLNKLESSSALNQPREIQIRMTFGETEIKLDALDLITGKNVKSSIEFLNGE